MKSLLLIFTLFFALSSIAQNKILSESRTISGTVTTTTGEPIEGVSIKVKGSKAGAITNAEGKFSVTIRTAGKHTLIFSNVGYASKEVEVDEQTTINVQLEGTNKTLDDVVVVGYGKQKKSDVTGAVTSIPKDRIENMVRTDVSQLLQGAAPGLNVINTAAGSNPENGSVLLIRGRNSISASNDPLIVLDGIPYNGTLSDINPNDVESIEILKDASSAAIYGSRASNGVILIQTVKADKGKMKVRYDGFYSFQSIANFPHLMNGDEYYQFKQAVTGVDTLGDAAITPAELAVYNSGSYNSFTWKDLVMRKGFSQQHNVSLSGGDVKTTYNVSLSYLGTQGVVINDQYKRGTSRINVTSNLLNG